MFGIHVLVKFVKHFINENNIYMGAYNKKTKNIVHNKKLEASSYTQSKFMAKY